MRLFDFFSTIGRYDLGPAAAMIVRAFRLGIAGLMAEAIRHLGAHAQPT
ncbi:hypothetical protein [Noviherbaspirillum suwonense]|jgi:hypothetical protein|nr:hypothetical protein [Noviherbaspirillum suwonense]